MNQPITPRIVFFDGVCSFCDSTVQFLIKRDRKGLLRYASLQGETAKKLLFDKGEPIVLDTMIFMESKGDELILHLRSKAATNICKYLPWPWKFLSIARWIPSFIGNFFYNIVAKNRYKWFGKMESCSIPTEHQRELFLP